MKRNYFNCNNLEDLKVQYKKLAMRHHPDRGGETATMQEINNQYDELFQELKDIHNSNDENKHDVTETVDMFKDIINAIINCEGLEMEICGTWMWISGNTREHKDILKANKCKWAKKKCMWYWRAEEYKSRRSRGNYSINDIRNKYGSESIHRQARPQLV